MPTTSRNNLVSLGDPDCPHCHGAGYLRADVPVGHPNFGRVEPCECRKSQVVQKVRDSLFMLSHLDELKHLTFNTFNVNGKGNLNLLEIDSLEKALDSSKEFANSLEGWIMLQGGYGCGKTHLAAAIANYAVDLGVPTLFITAPDLLDDLRASFNDPEDTFANRFETIRNVTLLVMDDFGTQNATPWAQEKLFQILNYRYINHLPTVLTTNLTLDEIEGRIRSRLQDDSVRRIQIIAPDYRRLTKDTSTPTLSSLEQYKDYSFTNFYPRDKEVGKTVRIKDVIEEDKGDGIYATTTVVTYKKITEEHLGLLKMAVESSIHFAEKPEGWLVLLGPSGCGKTHLAAAIANYRSALGYPSVLVDVSDLLDYLRATFNPNSVVKYDRRFEEIRTTPLLILDGFGKHSSSAWAEEKLNQIINFRYNAKLPTMITSQLSLDELEEKHESLFNKILDEGLCDIRAIPMPSYHHLTHAAKQPRGTEHQTGRNSKNKKGW